MIAQSDLIQMICQSIPDAQVDVTDKTGMSDHFIIQVRSKAFDGVALMDRHRQVMSCLEPAMRDGRLHAAEIKTELPA
jgi:stress-induced morphogen